MTTNRRDFLVSASAAVAATHLPAGAATADADAAAQKLLAEFAEELRVDYPESATSAGVDKEGRARLRSRLSNRSASGVATIRGHASATE